MKRAHLDLIRFVQGRAHLDHAENTGTDAVQTAEDKASLLLEQADAYRKLSSSKTGAVDDGSS